MRERVSRGINLCIGIIVLWTWVSMTFGLAPIGTQSESGLQNLKHFTVLSNLLQGGVSLAYFFGKKVDRWKYASTTALTLTFCVVIFYLAPKRGYEAMFSRANFFSHLVVPILAVVDFLFLDRSCTYMLRDTLYAMIPLVAYGLFYGGNLLINGVEGNDLYGFAKAGLGFSIAAFFVMLAMNWIIAALLRLPRRKSETVVAH